MKIKALLISFSLILFFIVNTGCKKEQNAEVLTIKIGALIPVSGGGASIGESSKVALQMAVNDFNTFCKEAGILAELSVDIKDTKTNPDVALQEIELLHEKGRQFIIGPYSSTCVGNIREFADANHIIILSPASVSTTLAIPDDNVFRLVPNDLKQGESLSVFLNDDGIEVIIPFIRNDTWGNDLLAATTQYFTTNNGVVVDAIKYDAGTSDFAPYITNLHESLTQLLNQYNVDKIGIYMISYGEVTDILELAIADSLLNQINWYGCSAYAENKNMVNDIDIASFAESRGLPCPVFGLDSTEITNWLPVMERLQQQLGRKPEIYALVTYDATWLAAFTLLKTGVTNNINIVKQSFVYEADHYNGVTGNTSLNAAGDREYATYDFWGVKKINGLYDWYVMAKFNNETGVLTRY